MPTSIIVNKHGFTLIELLIAISIVAIVFGIIISSLSTLKKNSRDAQRQSDLRAIQSYLEQYHTDQLFYPATILFGAALSDSTGSYSGASTSKTYNGKVPTDPINSGSHIYGYQGLTSSNTACDNSSQASMQNCVKYCLYASLENPPSNVSSQQFSQCATPPGGITISASNTIETIQP